MKMEVSKWFEFEAAHSLPHLPWEHKCHRLHGHSYKMQVTCAGDVNPDLGWVIDYADISRVVNAVITAIDHTNLDQLFKVPEAPPDPVHEHEAPKRKTRPSTAENLARWFFEQLKPSLPSVVEVRVKETASTEVVYRPETNVFSAFGSTPPL